MAVGPRSRRQLGQHLATLQKERVWTKAFLHSPRCKLNSTCTQPDPCAQGSIACVQAMGSPLLPTEPHADRSRLSLVRSSATREELFQNTSSDLCHLSLKLSPIGVPPPPESRAAPQCLCSDCPNNTNISVPSMGWSQWKSRQIEYPPPLKEVWLKRPAETSLLKAETQPAAQENQAVFNFVTEQVTFFLRLYFSFRPPSALLC